MDKKQIIRKIFLTTAVLAAGLTATAANPTVRDLDYKLDPSKIVAPESFEIETNKLMNDWYSNRYLIMDKDVDNKKTVELTDEEYKDRLQKIPTDLDMEMTFNPIVRSFIKMYVERRKGLVEAMLGRSLYYNTIFEEALIRHDVPVELRNLAIIESALNPVAVSKAGAAGLWQFMPATGQSMGLEINSLVDERRDPYKSSDAAARFLKKLYNTYGDWSLAIAAYNCGPGNVNKAIRRAGGGKKDFWEIYRFLPAETRDYVPAFIAANYAMHYYKDHNISPVLAKEPIIVDTVKVNRRIHFKQISDILGIPMEALRTLNPQYRKDVIPGDIKPYSLVLPNIQVLNYLAYEDSISNYNAQDYARRVAVTPVSSKVKDPNGEGYIDEVITVYHKVGKDDDIAMISKKHGIDEAEVIRANGGSKDLKRGATLELKVVNRRYMDGSTAKKKDNNNTPKTTTTTAPAEPAKPVAQTQPELDSPKTEKPNNVIPKGKPKEQPTRPTPPPPPAKKKETPQANTPAPKSTTPATPTKKVTTAMTTKTQPQNQNNKKGQADPDKGKGKQPAKNNNNNNNKNTPKNQQPATKTHQTTKGQNLTTIAKQHGVTVEEIKKANNLKNDKIQEGQKLVIPSKKAAPAAKGKQQPQQQPAQKGKQTQPAQPAKKKK